MKRIFALISGLVLAWPALGAVFLKYDGQPSVARVLAMQMESMLKQPVITEYPIDNATTKDVVVVVGRDGLLKVCEQDGTAPVIALFVGEEEFSSVKSSCQRPVTAVFSGGSIRLRIGVLASFWQDPVPVSLIYTDSLSVDPSLIVEAQKDFGLSIKTYPTSPQRAEALKVLTRAFSDTNLTMTLYDSELFTSEFARDAIRMSFHRQKVLVPHSASMVRAGALFTLYSDMDAKLNWLVRAINHYQSLGRLPVASYPTPIKVLFNPYLVKSHGIVLPTDAYLFAQFGLCPESGCEEALN